MQASFRNDSGHVLVDNLVQVIVDNKSHLSEIDGLIGDGDHGINMAKGFSMARDRIFAGASLTEALHVLSRVLLLEIGGSMGPLYGSFFRAMSCASEGHELVNASVFGTMLDAAYAEVIRLGKAKVGDKTLVDVLHPASEAYREAVKSGRTFAQALTEMAAAAEKGKESTRELVAKVGRSSRLGERSRGVLDAGATSCWLILTSMAASIAKLIDATELS